jgi:AsmA-like C-terminal region
MTNIPTTSPTISASASKRPRRLRRWLIGVGLVLILAAVASIPYIDAHWPYRYRNVEPLLETVFASKIKIDHYHRTYFPSPGFVATGLTLRRNSAPDLPPVGSAHDLVVQGRWIDLLLLRQRVRLVEVNGLHVVIPAVGSRANQEDFPPGSSVDFAGPTTVVEEFNLHDSILDIMRTNGDRYRFPIRHLVIRNLQKGKAIAYTLDMQNAKPTGRIQSTGSFGPLRPDNLGATPVSGKFTFAPVNLADIHGISGLLSAVGNFHGTLTAIEADATSDIPDFAVGRGRPTKVTASTHGTVNGLNGNVVLHAVEVHTGATTVHVQGNIVGAPKATNLDLTVTNGRAENILRPFLHDEAPITGAVSLRSHVYLAPSKEGLKFLQRLQVDGSFDIPAQRLTNRTTEKELSAFSGRAQGLKPTEEVSVRGAQNANGSDVLSSLAGRTKIRNGVVSTDRLSFQVPGAGVDLNGTFNLHDLTVHMLGNLQMQADISHVTTGFKSLLLKPLIPFFKKDNAGAVIPIAVTGGPGQYKVSQNLLHHK